MVAPQARGHGFADGYVPTLREARELARQLLGDQGSRLEHVATAGAVASRLAVLFNPEDAHLLAAAATLHDIGYSPRIAHSGFHPLDGATFLVGEGYSEQLAGLVAHHSLAMMTAGTHAGALAERFPPPEGLLADALAYADMHSAPDGRVIPVEHRLADIGNRHRDPVQVERARLLRLAIVRVGSALLDVEQADQPVPVAATRGVPLPRPASWRPARLPEALTGVG